jgi:tRNA pseudouridine55 synthase
MNGLLVVNKDKDMTSRDVVNIISRKFNTKKVGHTGTLDPIASGVLVVAIGKYTKLVDIITSEKKEYIATMKLGVLTDTLDTTGIVLDKKDYNFSKDELLKVLESFKTTYLQEVPKYSAVKINGKKLYEYARNNIDIELPKSEVTIYDIELLEYNNDTIKFRCEVSKGTYIRSLIRDIASKLNTYASMSDLIRTKQGIFSINNSYSLDDINNDKYILLTYKDIFMKYKHIELNDEEYFKVSNGQKMMFNSDEKLLILTYKNEYIAMYEKDNELYRIKVMF